MLLETEKIRRGRRHFQGFHLENQPKSLVSFGVDREGVKGPANKSWVT